MTDEDKFQNELDNVKGFESDLKTLFDKYNLKLDKYSEPFYGGCYEATRAVFDGKEWLCDDFEQMLENAKLFKDD